MAHKKKNNKGYKINTNGTVRKAGNSAKGDNSDMLLAKNICYSTDVSFTKRNSNVLMVGPGGQGKTQQFIVPNIKKLDNNFIIIDVHKNIYNKTIDSLKKRGYEVEILDYENVHDSGNVNYNPLAHVLSFNDIYALVDTIISTTEPITWETPDIGFNEADKRVLIAAIQYVYTKEEIYNRNLAGVIKFMELGEDNFIEKIETDMSPEIIRHALMSCCVRLAPISIPQVAKMTSDDTLNLETYKTEKKALFINLSPCDNYANFIASCALMQISRYFIIKSPELGQRRVTFIIDEAPIIAGFFELLMDICVAKSYGINYIFCFQSVMQIKAMYGEANMIDLFGNCTYSLFYGSPGDVDKKFFAKLSGVPLNKLRKMPTNKCLVCTPRKAVFAEKLDVM